MSTPPRSSSMTDAPPYIRPYIPSDLPILQHICEVTAAPQLKAGLPDLSIVPAIYCTPYLLLPSGISHILSLPPSSADPEHPKGKPIGYIIGTLNTRRFIAEYRDSYLPTILASRRYGPSPVEADALEKYIAEKGVGEDVKWIYQTLYTPEGMETVLLDEGLTAHLHIDILPEYQGKGYGVGLLKAYEQSVQEAVGTEGLRGYHLGMDERNDRAGRWYGKMGLRDLSSRVGKGRWMGKYLDGTWEGEKVEKK
ncbi:hypothetical protein BJ508DRAFT_301848 [Ascobolus immersus RN42]|uniref:N-acetyltransferase domain-containing protein n=1 Tax=Ascobolus immersus RN42 TaxID=1160509 RepID=A0A3N4ILE1_ASCIM|nr:hypothetical protein BJ508DRAFT_301848 [Ascobolus immersus RN42]